MKRVLEFLSNFYWLSIPETVVESFWYGDWDGAYRQAGLLGLLSEAGHSLLGTNTWAFFVPLDSHWSGADIRQLLGQYGIEMWGEGFHNNELFFRVRKDKAPWAQHILLQSGVPLQHHLIAGESKTNANSRRTSAKTNPRGSSVFGNYGEHVDERIDQVIDSIASALDL